MKAKAKATYLGIEEQGWAEYCRKWTTKTIQCGQCRKKFFTVSDLQRHEKDSHKCEVCQITFGKRLNDPLCEVKNEAAEKAADNGDKKDEEVGQQIEGHYSRGRGHRPQMGGGFRGRGGGGYPPFFPRGLRPPFPGAVPRFARHPPPYAFLMPMFGGMRYPWGYPMRSARPQFPQEQYEEEEDEDEEMSEDKKDEDEGNGPKPLMSIRTPKDIKESVKSQLRGKGPQLMVPLGMGKNIFKMC